MLQLRTLHIHAEQDFAKQEFNKSIYFISLSNNTHCLRPISCKCVCRNRTSSWNIHHLYGGLYHKPFSTRMQALFSKMCWWCLMKSAMFYLHNFNYNWKNMAYTSQYTSFGYLVCCHCAETYSRVSFILNYICINVMFREIQTGGDYNEEVIINKQPSLTVASCSGTVGNRIYHGLTEISSSHPSADEAIQRNQRYT